MFREELTAEGESAKAEMERLTASRAKVEEEALRVDAEEETLRISPTCAPPSRERSTRPKVSTQCAWR